MPLPLDMPLTDAQLRRSADTVIGLNAAIGKLQDRNRNQDCWLLAWVGDLHLHAHRHYDRLSRVYVEHVDTRANFAMALHEIARLSPRPRLLVLGGDLADSGCAGEAPADEYAVLRDILASKCPGKLPTLPIPGNHDHADRPLTPAWHQALAQAAPSSWPASPDPDDYYWAHACSGWRIVGLDSRQGQPLSERQRHWLAELLAADTNTPTVVCVHRPFLCVGNWVDDFRLFDRPSFDLLDRADHVRLIVSGHTHKTAAWSYRGKTHLVFPSSAYGIDDAIGWGAILMGAQEPLGFFTKFLNRPFFESVRDGVRSLRGGFHAMLPIPFVRDPKFNPCLLPGEEPS